MEPSEEEKKDYECAICYTLMSRPTIVPCGHKFCVKCLASTLSYAFKCPMCRSSIPPTFKPLVDRSLQKIIQSKNPVEFRRVEGVLIKQCLANKFKRRVKLLYGNLYEELANPSLSRDGFHLNKHRWTAFVKLHDDSTDISKYIKKVVFMLDPTFLNSTREVRNPPFEVACNGWGTFDVKITIHWHTNMKKEPSELQHSLIFHDNPGIKPFVLEYEKEPNSTPFLP